MGKRKKDKVSLADRVEAAHQERLEERIQLNAVEPREFGLAWVQDMTDLVAEQEGREVTDGELQVIYLWALLKTGNETNRLLARVSSQLNAMER